MQRLLALVAALLLASRPALATDPYAFFDWDVSYVTAAPLGVKQQASISGPYIPSSISRRVIGIACSDKPVDTACW